MTRPPATERVQRPAAAGASSMWWMFRRAGCSIADRCAAQWNQYAPAMNGQPWLPIAIHGNDARTQMMDWMNTRWENQMDVCGYLMVRNVQLGAGLRPNPG